MKVTARGWGLLAAGVVTAMLATSLQSLTAARIGALLAAITLVSLLWGALVRRFRSSDGLRRTTTPQTWQVDEPATVELVITGGQLPPWSSLRERVPTSLQRQSSAANAYQVRPTERGRVHLGPAVLHRSDPLALVQWKQEYGERTEVLVWPRVEPVAASVLAHSIEATSPRPHGTPQRTLEDLTVREYRRGDDLHRVHWRSTARHGELMVRHDEPTTTRVIDVLLVLSARRDEATEWAVSAAASIALALIQDDYTIRVLATSDGAVHRMQTKSGHDVLDVLALADATGDRVPELAGEVMRGSAAAVLAVLDRPERADIEALLPIGATHRCAAVALVPGGSGDGRGGSRYTRAEASRAVAMLRSGQWRVEAVTELGPIDDAWQLQQEGGAA